MQQDRPKTYAVIRQKQEYSTELTREKTSENAAGTRRQGLLIKVYASRHFGIMLDVPPQDEITLCNPSADYPALGEMTLLPVLNYRGYG